MRFHRMVLALGCLLAGSVGAAEPQDDLKKLQGTWTVTSMKCLGLVDPGEAGPKAAYMIEGDTILVKSSDGAITQKSTVKLDPSAKIKTMDWTILEATYGPLTSKTNPPVPGLHELSGDVLKVCWTSVPGKRPVSFDLKQQHAVMVIALARKK